MRNDTRKLSPYRPRFARLLSAGRFALMWRSVAILIAVAQIIYGVGVAAEVVEQSQHTRVPFLPDSAQGFFIFEANWTILFGPIVNSAVQALLVIAVVEILVQLAKRWDNTQAEWRDSGEKP